MKIKLLSSVIVCSLMLSFPIQSHVGYAADLQINETESINVTRAAGLIDIYTLSCSGGTKAVYITSQTKGTEVMSKVGFINIKIQRSSDQINWTTEKTVPDQIAKNVSSHSLSKYYVNVTGGYYYRIVLDHYAKEDTWWFPDEQSVSNTSNSVWIP